MSSSDSSSNVSIESPFIDTLGVQLVKAADGESEASRAME
jgi:hypothetical protein